MGVKINQSENTHTKKKPWKYRLKIKSRGNILKRILTGTLAFLWCSANKCIFTSLGENVVSSLVPGDCCAVPHD